MVDDKIWGRGVADMKCGTTASIFTFAYLYRIRDQLRGRLTLTAVSDEETFGPWGARYLMEHHPEEVLGDCCLNGEPVAHSASVFWRKGSAVKFTVRTDVGTRLYARDGKCEQNRRVGHGVERLSDDDTAAGQCRGRDRGSLTSIRPRPWCI